MLQLQHLRHHVGPSVLGIIRRAFAVGDGVAHDGDGAHVVAHGIHVDAADVVPVVLSESLLEVGVGVGYTFHDIRGGAGTHVDGRDCWGGSIVDGDGKSLERLEVIGQGIACDAFASWNRNLVLIAEFEIFRTLGVDGERVFGMGNIDRTDDNRFGTIDIAQFQTNHVASDAHLDHLSHGAVGHIVIIGHEALHDGLWGSSPCAYPSLCRSIDCYSAEENKKCNNSFHSSLIICDI